ncbi:hypothetical protein ACVGWX_00445, partial [Enterobacter hormaechei]
PNIPICLVGSDMFKRDRTGGAILVFGDWCGWMVVFPYQFPAGHLSTFSGPPYFFYLLRKQSRY